MANIEPQETPEKSAGEKNKEHFNKVAADAFSIPWVVELSNFITSELQQNAEWIGFKGSSSDVPTQGNKLLDYACGNGLATRAFAEFFDITRGIDISSGMVEQYNKKATTDGFSPEKRRAIQGDLLNPDATPSPELNSSEFFDFDAIAMCASLHHVEDYIKMIEKLSERLKQGGVLVIVDGVAPHESGCAVPERAKQASNDTITRMGFTEEEVKTAYKNAGLEGWAWKWASRRFKMPDEIGGEQQLFIAHGQKGE